MSVGGVLPCAGLGKRMGAKEPGSISSLKDCQSFIHTIKVFEIHPDIDVVVARGKKITV